MRCRKSRFVAVISLYVGPTRGRVSSDLLDFTCFGETKQDRLHPQAHFTKFVEEQRAAIRLLHEPAFIAVRTSKASARVPKEFRFQKGLGNPAAVHGDERTTAARALLMNQAGDYLFANPGFPQNQDFGVGPGGRYDFAAQGNHLRTFTKKHRRVHHRTPEMLKHAFATFSSATRCGRRTGFPRRVQKL